jgi:hypothetical protein
VKIITNNNPETKIRSKADANIDFAAIFIFSPFWPYFPRHHSTLYLIGFSLGKTTIHNRI